MTGVLIRRKFAHRYREERSGRWPWGDAVRNWNDEAAGSRDAKGPREPPETRSEAENRLSLEPQRQHGPADTLISDF